MSPFFILPDCRIAEPQLLVDWISQDIQRCQRSIAAFLHLKALNVQLMGYRRVEDIDC